MAAKFDLQTLLPRHIKKLVPPKPAAQPTLRQLAAQTGQAAYSFDQNENAWGSIGTDQPFHRYPDPHSTALRAELAEYQKVKPENICVGNGTDELLDLLIRAICTPMKDQVFAFAPAEPRIKRLATINALTYTELPLNRFFQLPLYQAKSQFSETTKLIFLANPNPISGVPLHSFDIVDLLDSFQNGLIVIDESYIDYASEKSLLPYLSQYPNLVVLQSFSKAWGLAGLRLGVVYAHSEVIEVLNAMRPCFSVNSVAQEYGVKALHLPELKKRHVEHVQKERDRLQAELLALRFVEEISGSEANFLLVKFDKPAAIQAYLRSEQIEVFNAEAYPLAQSCLRIAVRTPEENERLLAALREYLAKTSPTRRFLDGLSRTFQKAGVFLGFFKKLIGG